MFVFAYALIWKTMKCGSETMSGCSGYTITQIVADTHSSFQSINCCFVKGQLFATNSWTHKTLPPLCIFRAGRGVYMSNLAHMDSKCYAFTPNTEYDYNRCTFVSMRWMVRLTRQLVSSGLKHSNLRWMNAVADNLTATHSLGRRCLSCSSGERMSLTRDNRKHNNASKQAYKLLWPLMQLCDFRKVSHLYRTPSMPGQTEEVVR